MNKFKEKAKDLFYDTTDYAIIVLVVICVSGIIVWRLNSLFDENTNRHVSNPSSSTESVEKSKEDKKPSDDLIEKEKLKQKGITIVNIPEDALPPVIANILLDNGIIQDKLAFLKRAQEMGLDTKMRPGEYEFSKDMSLEDIIKTITRQ